MFLRIDQSFVSLDCMDHHRASTRKNPPMTDPVSRPPDASFEANRFGKSSQGPGSTVSPFCPVEVPTCFRKRRSGERVRVQ